MYRLPPRSTRTDTPFPYPTLSRSKPKDPVHPFGQPFIMRGNNSRRAFLPHEAEEFSKNDIGSMFVQIAGRLVSKNKGRAVGERASDGDALLFASRKLAWAMTEAMAET